MTTERKITEKNLIIWKGIEEYVTDETLERLKLIVKSINIELLLLNGQLNYDVTGTLDSLEVIGRLGNMLILDFTIDITQNCLCQIDYLSLQKYIKSILKTINSFIPIRDRLTNKDIKITTSTDKKFIVTLLIHTRIPI